jgi:hypothetical protein
MMYGLLFTLIASQRITTIACKDAREYFPGGSTLTGVWVTLETDTGTHQRQFGLTATDQEYMEFIQSAIQK